MGIIEELEKEQMKEPIPLFNIGDTVRVHANIIEGDRTRVQPFEGIVIARKGSGLSETFTVRKISYGVGVERLFPLHSPQLLKIEVIRRGKVRKAKLYYLRKKKGSAARVKELGRNR